MSTPSIVDLHASAASPDETVYGEISGRYDVRYTFAPRYYAMASAREIGDQLEQLHPLLFRARMAAYYRIRSAQEGHLVTPPPRKPEKADYDAARDELLAVGDYNDGLVRMTALGMRTWTVEISTSARNTLDEYGMAVACGRAATAMVHDQYRQIAGLKRQFFGS